MKTGIELIAEERANLEALGLVASQQDLAKHGQLAGAAACYALTAAYYFGNGRNIVAGIWPLTDELFERDADDLTKLARAGALIAMEMERLQRVKEVEEEKPLIILP